jgi:DNA topoisomerase-1
VAVLDAFYDPFAAAVKQAEETAKATSDEAPKSEGAKAQPTGEECPKCGGPVVIREGQYGQFRACTNFPRCKWSAPVAVGTCPQCGKDLVERKGKRGMFWGCSGYPECRYTEDVKPAPNE